MTVSCPAGLKTCFSNEAWSVSVQPAAVVPTRSILNPAGATYLSALPVTGQKEPVSPLGPEYTTAPVVGSRHRFTSEPVDRRQPELSEVVKFPSVSRRLMLL